MTEIRPDVGRRLVVCDVCLTYADHDDPITATWHRATPSGLGGPDRCSDCAIPPRYFVVAEPFVPALSPPRRDPS